jgi:hypothetical protein
MNINAFPTEILSAILELAAEANKETGVTFTFGLNNVGPAPRRNFQRYVKGPVPPSLLKWDSTQAIRSVCSRWHEWGVGYALKDAYIKCWRGSERWVDLTLDRSKQPFPFILRLHGRVMKYKLQLAVSFVTSILFCRILRILHFYT